MAIPMKPRHACPEPAGGLCPNGFHAVWAGSITGADASALDHVDGQAAA